MLTEMVVDSYIPNDTNMTEDDSRIQVSICNATVYQSCLRRCCAALACRIYAEGLQLPVFTAHKYRHTSIDDAKHTCNQHRHLTYVQ